jgi:hypothetical protein
VDLAAGAMLIGLDLFADTEEMQVSLDIMVFASEWE